MPTILSGVGVERAHRDVERALVVGDARLGSLARRAALGRIALHEVDDRGRLLPDLFVELAVEHDRAGRGHGHGIDRGDDARRSLAAANVGASNASANDKAQHTNFISTRIDGIRVRKVGDTGRLRQPSADQAKDCPGSQRTVICNYLPSIISLEMGRLLGGRVRQWLEPPRAARIGAERDVESSSADRGARPAPRSCRRACTDRAAPPGHRRARARRRSR